jgi:hypothetical protein
MTSSSACVTVGANAWGRRWGGALVLALLAAQNVWMFAGHWAGTALFPWDFGKTYHAVPFFWTTAAGAGTFPTWVPFQGPGYPLAMNLQSGLFYPPLWVFPTLGLTYSLHAAIVFQLLHVLFGAFGMSVLARTRGFDWRAAALVGAAYQVFGGFFSNAQHPDIVRGYAWTPWLLAALSVAPREGEQGSWRVRLLPLVVLAFLTGAYPGQGPVALLLGALYLVLQLFAGETRPRLARENTRPVLLRAAGLGLGGLMAAVHLLPPWLLRDELLRSSEAANLERTGLGAWNAFTTFLPYDVPALEGDVSMRSLFLTVPVLVGVFLLPARELVRERALVALLLAAGALAQAGPALELAARVVPPLGLSRFPAADYRALLAAPLVLLGGLGLRAALQHGLWSWSTLPRGLALGAFVWAGLDRWGPRALPEDAARALLIVLGATVVVLLAAPARGLGARHGALVLLGLVLVDGRREHQLERRTWSPVKPGREQEWQGDFEALRRELEAELARERTERPAREGGETFDGYRRGAYVIHDYAASDHLAVVDRLTKRSLAKRVMRPSEPVLIAEGTPLDPLSKALEQPLAPEQGSAACRSFARDRIRYAVSTRGPAWLVENEPAFPGWTAVRADSGVELEPVPAAWPLRAWRLPPGEYEVTLAFRMPALVLAAALSLVAVAAWLLFLFMDLSRSPTRPQPT